MDVDACDVWSPATPSAPKHRPVCCQAAVTTEVVNNLARVKYQREGVRSHCGGAASEVLGRRHHAASTRPSKRPLPRYWTLLPRAGWDFWQWQGHRVHYIADGPLDGEPVLLIHGERAPPSRSLPLA